MLNWPIKKFFDGITVCGRSIWVAFVGGCRSRFHQRRTEQPGYLVLARWAGWSGVLVGGHVIVEVSQTTYPVNK